MNTEQREDITRITLKLSPMKTSRPRLSDVGDKTRLGSEWRGGLNTLRLKQQKHTMYSRNRTHKEFVISLIHRPFVEHSFIRKKKETIVMASVHMARALPS